MLSALPCHMSTDKASCWFPEADAATCSSLSRRYDEHTHERFIPGDPSKRAFTYFVLTGGRFIYASAIRVAVLKFILSMTVSLGSLASVLVATTVNVALHPA